jgi:hypothetical protein
MLDVLQWLVPLMDKSNKTIILAAGGLIKILRDKTFFWKNGTPIDLDIDFMASYGAFDLAAKLEPILWKRFGWAVRTFVNCDGYTVFMQLISACGHKFSDQCNKAEQPEPGIELYAFHKFRDAAAVGILWEQECFPSHLIFPRRKHSFHLTHTESKKKKTIDFYIPHYAEDLLSCIYGNWSVYAGPSSRKQTKQEAHDCFLEVAQQSGFVKESSEALGKCDKYYIDRE